MSWTPAAALLAACAPPALARTLGALSPSLPAMPRAPLLERYLYESPWPVIVLAILAGVIAVLAGRRLDKPLIGALGLIGALLIGAGAFVTSRVVTTDREHLAVASRALVGATADADAPALRAILDPEVRVRSAAGSPEGRDSVVALVERYIPRWSIERARVPQVRSALEGDEIAWSQIEVKIKADLVPPTSWWRVDWAKDPAAPDDDPWGGWRATQIEPIWILGVRDPGG